MSSGIINPVYKTRVYLGIAATTLAAGAVFTPWESVKIIGLTVLTGVIYKAASNIIACRDCIHFFSVDGGYYAHSNDHFSRSLVKNLDPNLNAFAYAINTWDVNAIVGSVFAFVARVSFNSLKYKVTSAQLLPYFVIGAVVTFALSHFTSRLAEKKMEQLVIEEGSSPIRLTNDFYQLLPMNLQAKWAACDVRNAMSLRLFALGGVALVGAILAVRMGSIKLSSPFNP